MREVHAVRFFLDREGFCEEPFWECSCGEVWVHDGRFVTEAEVCSHLWDHPVVEFPPPDAGDRFHGQIASASGTHVHLGGGRWVVEPEWPERYRSRVAEPSDVRQAVPGVSAPVPQLAHDLPGRVT